MKTPTQIRSATNSLEFEPSDGKTYDRWEGERVKTLNYLADYIEKVGVVHAEAAFRKTLKRFEEIPEPASVGYHERKEAKMNLYKWVLELPITHQVHKTWLAD